MVHTGPTQTRYKDMTTFKVYYEGFSLNPLNWIIQRNNLLRSNAKNSKKYIQPLKDFLRSKNYEIIKSNEGSYTARLRRVVALDPKEDKKVFGNLYKKDNLLSSPEIRKLFTLAHEVGHVLQWNDETNTKHKFDEFYDAQKNSDIDLKDLHTLWYELDAWIQGMQFIPIEYKQKYKRYAYDSYKTYMDKSPKSYGMEMLLRNLLYKLNSDEQ
jgi:hypothetical protein